MTAAPPLLGARRLQELFQSHGLRPKKSLGQNFVVDPNTIRKVLAAAELTGNEHVLEIGAGPGSLTLGLAGACAKVTAIEIDPGLLPVLQEVLATTDNVDVVQGDAMQLDLAAIPATRLVANLPYNVATPVVLKVLETAPQITDLLVMTQREVGARLAAAPGTKVYGAPTVMAAYFASAKVAVPIARKAFWPVPNVDSVMVRLTRREVLPGVDHKTCSRVVAAAFGQRRKTLRNSLAPIAGSPAAAAEVLARAGIEATARPEDIPPERFFELAALLAAD